MVDEPSPDRILRIGLGYQASQVLMTAVRLGVFEVLAAGPAGVEELIGRIGVHPRAARDFLDALVALRFLQRDAAGRYRNSPDTAEFLDPGRPGYLGAIFCKMQRTEYALWGALPDALRDGKPRSTGGRRGDVYAGVYEDSEQIREFAAMMSALNTRSAPRLAADFPWHNYRTFTDLGCAEGFLPVQLARAHTHLTGVGFDLPVVRGVFEQYVARHGLAHRLTFQAGDFFTEPLPATDVHIYAHILHNWDLEGKRALIANAYRALPPGGALIVQEAFIDEDRRTSVAAFLMSLHMLLETDGGFDCTAADCAGWLTDAGFDRVYTAPLTAPDAIVVGHR